MKRAQGGILSLLRRPAQISKRQQRFQQRLADLGSSGNPRKPLISKLGCAPAKRQPNLDEKFHALMQASTQPMMEKRFNDAENLAKEHRN